MISIPEQLRSIALEQTEEVCCFVIQHFERIINEMILKRQRPQITTISQAVVKLCQENSYQIEYPAVYQIASIYINKRDDLEIRKGRYGGIYPKEAASDFYDPLPNADKRNV